jgi:site-specific recombinase XerD
MEHYIKGFGQWLERLGYADSTIYGYGRRVNTFFLWMEQQGLTLATLTKTQLDNYRHHLEHRPKKINKPEVCASPASANIFK